MHQVNKIKRKLEDNLKEKVKGLADIENRRKDEERQKNLNYKEEMKNLKKYKKIGKLQKENIAMKDNILWTVVKKNENELVSILES